MIVADTDVLIDSLAGMDPARARVDLELSSGRLATTAVTAFELLSGARRKTQRTKIERLLDALTILPLESGTARMAADLRLDLESRGEGVGMADYLIAAICLSRNAMLLTLNRNHFERFPRLHLARMSMEDWGGG